MKVSFPTERDLEQYLFEHLESCGYFPLTDQEYSQHFRQLEIPGYGITDLVLVDADPTAATITVVELKNTELNASHMEQLGRYMTGIQRFADFVMDDEVVDGELSVRGILAGPFNPRNGGLVWLYHQTENIELYSVSIDVDSGFEAEAIEKTWFSKGEKPESLHVLTDACNDAINHERKVLEFLEESTKKALAGAEDA